MNIYVDQDSVAKELIKLLRKAGHDLLIPNDIGMSAATDPEHFLRSIGEGRALITKNHKDFAVLHELITISGGHHPGILAIRQDNDRNRDLTPKGIVTAIRKLEAAGVPIADQFIILNHWR